jgi:hypothetical protein
MTPALDQNYYQSLTSPEKLRGRFYTPDALVGLIFDGLNLSPGHMVLDPACGDGSFLRGAVAAVARRFRGADRQALARHWAGRIVGFDVDAGAAAEARARLQEAFRVCLGVDLPREALRVHQVDALCHPRLAPLLRAPGAPGVRDCQRLLVVGNPPYVEAKRLPREMKAVLKARYPDAVTGAPDLYLYFLHVCLGWLRRGDALAFVLPNKMLVNANAEVLRERLIAENRLRGLWFATRIGVFEGAAVYPVVLFAGGPGGNAGERVETAQVERANGAGEDWEGAGRGSVGIGRGPGFCLGESISLDPAWYGRTASRAFFPPPETGALQEALARLLKWHERATLHDALDIRWSISFHRAGLRERFVLPQQPDDPAAQPFLGGGAFSGNGEVARYRLDWNGWWIRYAQAELHALGNPLPDPGIFAPPKIVICQNGRTLRAAYDDQGFVLKDTFLCGVIREGPQAGGPHPLCRHPRALVGLLCSAAVHFFFSHVFYGGHVNGGYLHFLRSFLVDVPLGTWTEAAAQEVAALVEEREQTTAAPDQQDLEAQIEKRVAEALGLTHADQQAIAAWAEADANWKARARVRAPETRDAHPGRRRQDHSSHPGTGARQHHEPAR